MHLRRTTFDPGPAPANYVAGLGRGASGFTTRSDIGEARAGPVAPLKPDGDQDAHADYSESTYDKFSGYSENLFAGVDYDEADKEADSIWEKVDTRMDERSAEKRNKREKKELEKVRKETPKVQLEFADLTKKLSTLSEEDWMSIPEIGDSHIRKSRPAERYVPVPDSMLAAAHNSQVAANTVQDTPGGGLGSAIQDLTSVGKAQKLQLDTTLAKASATVVGQAVVNTLGYMTDLNASRSANEDMVDINKARDLLTNVTVTNPSHAPGWIAAARLEHIAGKISTARKIMLKGCAACPKSEDVWLEAARLHTPENAKIIFARAVQNVPTSVKLWLSAAQLEESVEHKKRVLRKGIEMIPKSVDLWKAAIELEEPEDARVMLERAVECVPHSVDMWLALAHMLPYDRARKTLNRAREAMPTEAQIWIAAARLEEAQKNEKGIATIIARAVTNLAAHNVIISRQRWLEDAYKAEASGSPLTAAAIVKATIGIGVEDVDRKRMWMTDAATAEQQGHYHCARAIYAHARTVFPTKKSMWRRAAELEKAHGSAEALNSVLQDAVRNCPQSELLWLFFAREKWKSQNQADEARKILHEAFAHNPESERIWLAAVRLETECGAFGEARTLLSRARSKSNTPKVWVKSVKLERFLNEANLERELLEEAITVHPKCAKLWLLFSELESQSEDPEKARQLYARAVKNCPQSLELWLAACSLEEQRGQLSRARAMLESARFKNPGSPLLWKRAIAIEDGAGMRKIAESMLAKALQECPVSGVLWALAISFASKTQQRERCTDALKRCDKDALVLLAVAKVFWSDRKLDKAKVWLERACALDPKLGDAWCYLYLYARQHETAEAQTKAIQRCVAAEPNKGEHWTAVSKSLEWVRNKQSTEQLLMRVIERIPLVA
jgi:pre-mRNA-processing factor 6